VGLFAAGFLLLRFVLVGGVAPASPQFAATLQLTYSSQTPRAPSGLDA
jgi:hypothetical protein